MLHVFVLASSPKYYKYETKFAIYYDISNLDNGKMKRIIKLPNKKLGYCAKNNISLGLS